MLKRSIQLAAAAWLALLVVVGEPYRLPAASAQAAAGTIAYIKGGDEIRLIEPDGSDDRLLWGLPNPESGDLFDLDWRPDGGELAFISNHQAAYSLYEADLYAIQSNGTGLRRITNAPGPAGLAGYPKGTVTVVINNQSVSGGPLIVYVAGAAEPQGLVLAPGNSQTVTFHDVADFGPGKPQFVVVMLGMQRWINAGVAADVVPGTTVHAGTLTLFGDGLRYLVDAPSWRSDGSAVGLTFGNCAGLYRIPAQPAPGTVIQPLVEPAVAGFTCLADWGPTAALANQVLFVESGFEGHIYRAAEGSTDPGEPLITYDGFELVLDLQWLPDGSGFLFSLTGGDFSSSANLWEYTFAGPSVKPLTNFTDEFVGHFSVSPDGQQVVFERGASLDDTSPDLWIMDRDGGNLRLLVSNALRPAWGAPASSGPLPYAVYLPALRR